MLAVEQQSPVPHLSAGPYFAAATILQRFGKKFVLSKTTICSIDELVFAFYNAIYKNISLFFERMLCEVF